MESALTELFEFLFKYRPVVFERGDFAFAAPVPLVVLILVCLALAVPAVLSYTLARGRASRRDKIVLGALRVLALALVVFCLLRPTLAVSEAVPQRNVLAILVDDSRSMRIADDDGRTRADAVARLLGGSDSTLLRGLSERFLLRYFRVGSGASRIDGPSALSYRSGRTQLASALSDARQELGGVPLAGVVLLSDGADNAQALPGSPDLEETLLDMRARNIPIYTVGLGREQWTRDIQISRVEASRTALEGATVVVTAMIQQRGYAGRTVPLLVEEGSRIVSRQEVTLPDDGETAPVHVRVPATEAGVHMLSFRVPPQPGEMVQQNNSRSTLLRVRDERQKILYIEGEPRFEPKFIRRAVEDDPQLQLVTLQRTAENKFLRMDVDDSLELISGFPKTREELFAYRGLVIGSIEASFFTLDQLRMIADFVAERGGGLLMLGGRLSFGEGGYAGTPVGEVLPVEMPTNAPSAEQEPYFVPVHVVPTPAGMAHALTQVAPSESASVARFRTLPPLSMVNRVRRIKAGATMLLAGEDTASNSPGSGRSVVLAWQRYGRGTAIAFPVQDSWMWQMHADISVEDQTHENFWRQMLRWLVSDVPGQTVATAGMDQVEPGDAVPLDASVRGRSYLEINDASVQAHITAPDGDTSTVPMEWAVEQDGEYHGSFAPTEAGMYRIRMEALQGDSVLPDDEIAINVGELPTEYFDAEMREPLLSRIAEETGGRFYTEATAGALARDVVYTRAGTTVLRELELWNMPAVFFLLATVVAGEWALRRKRGLA